MARMAMPETAMHEDHGVPSSEDQIGAAREPPVVQPVAEAARMQALADQKLRFRVLAPDAGHHPAARFRIDDIRQQPFLSPPLPEGLLRRG